MRRAVGLAKPFRLAAAGAALVEQHGVKALRIEQAAMVGLAAGAGAAVQIHGRDAAGAADALDVDFVAVADIEMF